MSGEPYLDIIVSCMFIKNLFDTDSLLMFDTAVQAEIDKGTLQIVKLILDTQRNMVLNQIPCRACLTKQLERVKRNNQMRNSGKHTMTLIFYMDQCGWSTMITAEVTILFWLMDLKSNNKHQAEFPPDITLFQWTLFQINNLSPLFSDNFLLIYTRSPRYYT